MRSYTIPHSFLTVLRRFIIIPSMMILGFTIICSCGAYSQVKIKETVTIKPKGRGNAIRSPQSFSESPTITFSYHRIGTSGTASIELVGPCASYHQTNTSQSIGFCYQDVNATITFTQYDPGPYYIYITQHANCDWSCGYISNCSDYYYTYNSVTGQGGAVQGPVGDGPYQFNGPNIVDCGQADLQPQTLDPSSIEVYDENGTFRWTANGLAQSYMLSDGCLFQAPDPTYADLGKVYLIKDLPVLGPLISYERLSDKTISVCRNNADGNWHFHISHLRFPIFNSLCVNSLLNNGWIDLGDGTDQGKLSQNIHNCDDANNVLKLINFLYVGPYTPGNIQPIFDKKYFFSPGVIGHENRHERDLDSLITKEFNDMIFPYLARTKASLSEFSCANDAVQSQLPGIDTNLKGAYDEDLANQKLDESRADDAAKDEYKIIFRNIRRWAIEQHFVDQNSRDCILISLADKN